ncbi:MAG: glycosyltransferase family 4 protein [Clostridia bacterium]|nr:glycosyltransferase family 4 protein [Clostridia bacterium]
MNILFLSVYEIKDSNSGYIYADLISEFAKHDHNIYAVTPTKSSTQFFTDTNGVKIIKIKNGQIQKTGRVKKVINLLTLEKNTVKAIKKFAKNVKFDLVINMSSNLSYSKTMTYFKKRDNAVAYLLLKDIFPQNAVDMKMIKTSGLSGIIYNHFKKKEKKVYKAADYIGCMSKANLNYVSANNPDIDLKKLTIVPNSIIPQDTAIMREERDAMRAKYGLPLDKTIFVYGGNLGKPQGIPFIIECLKSQKDNDDAFFFIVGDGTEYGKLEQFAENVKPANVKIMKRLPREDFDSMLASCDVGMIFLDHRFTVPNYPSRLLSYLQAGLPVFACTDANSDVGKDAVDNGFGWWCASDSVDDFVSVMDKIKESNLGGMSENAKKFLCEKNSAEMGYNEIMAVMQ